MPQAEPELRTTDALALAGVPQKLWENMVSREQFTAAPPTTTTHPRMFGVDDVVVLFIVRHFLDLNSGPAMAGRIGAAVRKELTKAASTQQFLWVAFTIDGTPRRVTLAPPPDDIASTRFPLAVMRRTIREAVAAKLAEQGQ